MLVECGIEIYIDISDVLKRFIEGTHIHMFLPEFERV